MRTDLRRVLWLGGAALLAAGCQSQATDGAKATTSSAIAQAAPPTTQWTDLDEKLLSPVWSGNDDRGTLYAPLWRGAFQGIEDYVYAPPDGDCTKTKSTIRIDWDAQANTVHFLIKGKGFVPHPVVHRTEGVDWWPDPFHPAPKDVDDGAYRIWIVLGSTTRQANFWYSGQTLQLLGSDFDFPNGPPAGTIPVAFPVFSITGSSQFSPDENGTVVHEWTVPYDHVTVESGTFARALATFPPLDLCEAAPLQPAISQLRPYVSPWQPAASAPSWRDMLHAGMGFDLHIEDRRDPGDAFGGNLPYVYSGISYVSNMTALQGGVPNGWHGTILSAIQNVSPVLEQTPDGNGKSCHPWVSEPHVTAPRYCEMAH